MGQKTTVLLQRNAQPSAVVDGETFAFGPPADWDCLSAASSTCFTGNEGGDTVILFGITKGTKTLYVDLEMILDDAQYVATAVYPITPYAPDPVNSCSHKTGATSFAVSVDTAYEHIVAVVLQTAPGGNVWGDIVRAEFSRVVDSLPGPEIPPGPPPNPGNGGLAPGMGDDNPHGEPKGMVCPLNWNDAVETQCSDDRIGVCTYNYVYHGCTYDKLDCVQGYSCDCQKFMANKNQPFRCWGQNRPLPTCPPSSPTANLVGKMCDPHAPLPKDPNPPAAVCPSSPLPATTCDTRLSKCSYGYHLFGCNEFTTCVPSTVCDCLGRWVCYGLNYNCPVGLEDGIPATPFSPCTP